MLSQSISSIRLSGKYYYIVSPFLELLSGGVERAIVKESEDLSSTSDWPCDFGFPIYEMRAICPGHFIGCHEENIRKWA